MLSARYSRNAFSKLARNKSSGGNSFHADTLFRLVDGYRRIADVEPGVHEVWSKDKVTSERKMQFVMELFQKEHDETVRLTVFDCRNNLAVGVVSNTVHLPNVAKLAKPARPAGTTVDVSTSSPKEASIEVE